MKDLKKGITLVALIATVVIMVILATTISISAVTVSNNAKRINFATEISYVQELVYTYNLKSNSYPVSDSILLDLSGVSSKEIVQFDKEQKDNNKIILYKVDMSLLGKSELKYGNMTNNEDVYAVSKTTGNVYYVKGVKIGSRTYYTLTEDLKKAINYVDLEQSNEMNKDGIVFVPSSTNWTNKNVDMQVKIPKDYINASISISQNGSVIKTLSDLVSDEKYNVYNINNVKGNYNVIVNYTKNGNISKQEYLVNNYEDKKPTFTLSNAINMEQGSSIKKYVKVENLLIGNSGLKTIKYEVNNINENDIAVYFKTNGIDVNNNVIVLDPSIQNITVYVEDNAGNYSYRYLNLVDKTSYLAYERKNLILQLDSLYNTKEGHDSSSTTWEDLSGKQGKINLQNFNLTNCWGEDKLYFDGIDDVLDIMNNAALGSEFTVIVNVHFDERNNFRGVFGGHSLIPGLVGAQWENGSLGLTIYPGETKLSLSSDLIKDRSVIVLKVKSGNYQMAYIDGVKVKEVNLAVTFDKLNDRFYLGKSYNSTERFLKGYVSSLLVYNRALTDEEIKRNYEIEKIRYKL